MSGFAPQIPCVVDGETRNGKIDYTDVLDAGELLSGIPTLTEKITSDLTFANQAVSTGELTILDNTVITGQAVQFKVTGSLADVLYTVEVSVATNSTPAQTLKRKIRFQGVD